MKYYYTATERFGIDFDPTNAWQKYIEFSKLTHVSELVSLDNSLNATVFEPDRGDPGDWNFIVIDNLFETGLFNSLDYVMSKVQNCERYNLLTVVREPDQDCEKVSLPGLDFLGYELLDKDYSTSALSNCEGFSETFLPNELNEFGLIQSFENAFDIRSRLLKNNPMEYHADCNVLAIWRHKELGQGI